MQDREMQLPSAATADYTHLQLSPIISICNTSPAIDLTLLSFGKSKVCASNESKYYLHQRTQEPRTPESASDAEEKSFLSDSVHSSLWSPSPTSLSTSPVVANAAPMNYESNEGNFVHVSELSESAKAILELSKSNKQLQESFQTKLEKRHGKNSRLKLIHAKPVKQNLRKPVIDSRILFENVFKQKFKKTHQKNLKISVSLLVPNVKQENIEAVTS
ncbi:hypothetical protein HK100_009118 [Physocladia obscura]|uniref:Uncharacterized protein n=1 Tax=Physocladia obscura TaxID=109957 RepID=A0AAD5T9X9_9FUNG|nr:hypothetical protein HK100_009118 [Physocladia obscura]